ncbi:MAG: hypothetical protein HGA45_19305 [Chloroflexales bacterium]|nr:hypothetical protein [Chloroflexales bacterium]
MPRLRDLAITIGRTPPGPNNTLTDAPQFPVGHSAATDALCAAEAMTGRGGYTTHPLPHGRLAKIMELHRG